MHLRVCFGVEETKDYNKTLQFSQFIQKLSEFDYTSIKKETLDTITYEINHFTSIRGGKFTIDILEQTHEACAILGSWIINWHLAGKVYIKIRAIEEE